MAHYSYYWITLWCIVVYWRTIFYGYVIDDIEWSQRLSKGFLKKNPQYLLYSHLGLKPAYDHAITIALHIITVLLIAKISFIAAMLYSIHPCNHQTSIWLNGRRYSILNIVVLSISVSHLYFFYVPVAIISILFAQKQLSMRQNLPQPKFSYYQTLITSVLKLSGLIQYSFIYPDGPAPFIPHTQPVAERYLSIPLIIWCVIMSHMPFIWLIIPVYTLRTYQLMPMYTSIQSFYDYHQCLYPRLNKLNILPKLYNQIIKIEIENIE